MGKKIIIVGGCAAGASAAAQLRRLDETAEIILLEKGAYTSYASCGLPYYVGGVIDERRKLLVQTPAAMQQRFNLDVRTGQEAVALDLAAKTVMIKDHKDGRTYEESYDSLLLCTGAAPSIPDVPGIDKKNVFLVRDIPDSEALKGYIAANRCRAAVVIGGGAVGLETAEMLRHLQMNVHIVDAADHVLPSFDSDMAAFIHTELFRQGVGLHLKAKAQSLNGDGDTVTSVSLDNGETLDADVVILSLGVRPAIRLGKEAGLVVGAAGGIQVDEYLRTSDPAVWAAGDVVEVTHLVSGKKTVISSAGPANRQGRQVAGNMCGAAIPCKGVQGVFIVKVFERTGASTGLNEAALQRLGIPYRCAYLALASHATYYPGASLISMKILFDPEDGRLLGAQFVGQEGVDKRIDVFATALHAGMTVFDLEDLELAYSPPYSSARDPLNVIGYAAAHVVRRLVDTIHWRDVPEYIKEHNAFLLDVRTDKEAEQEAAPGTDTRIPVNSLRERQTELPKDRELLIYCQAGLRSYVAAHQLRQSGFKVKIVNGGRHFLPSGSPSHE